MAKIIDIPFIEEGSRLMLLVNEYLSEFPGDEDFIDICNSPMSTDYDELETTLANRKKGQRISEKDSDDVVVDYMPLIYS